MSDKSGFAVESRESRAARRPAARSRALAACALGLLLLFPAFARASVSETVQGLEEIVKLWEEQAAGGNKPGAGDCEYMKSQLEKAKKELEDEKKKYEDARNNPPTRENGTRGITAGWARYMADWARKLQDLEKRIKDLERRIGELCPPAAGAGADGKGKGGGKDSDRKSELPRGNDVPTYDPRFYRAPGIPRSTSVQPSRRGGSAVPIEILQLDLSGSSRPTATKTLAGIVGMQGSSSACCLGGRIPLPPPDFYRPAVIVAAIESLGSDEPGTREQASQLLRSLYAEEIRRLSDTVDKQVTGGSGMYFSMDQVEEANRLEDELRSESGLIRALQGAAQSSDAEVRSRAQDILSSSNSK